jgi:hypothetical protein
MNNTFCTDDKIRKKYLPKPLRIQTSITMITVEAAMLVSAKALGL